MYLWVDGIYLKAGLEKDKAALLVVLAALSDGQKVVLAVVPGHRESTASWGGGPPRSQVSGLTLAEAGDGRWLFADLGVGAECVSRRRGAALLEPQDPQCA